MTRFPTSPKSAPPAEQPVAWEPELDLESGLGPENNPETVSDAQSANPGKQRLVKRVVTPAFRWWLNTQVQAATQLDIQLHAQDRQLFSGYLPLVQVIAAGVIYQGLYLSQARLQAENIRVNLGQVLRGKPLKLMEPIQAWGEIHLSQSDLQQSLDSELMRGALRDLLGILVTELGISPPDISAEFIISQAAINFGDGELTCTLDIQATTITQLTFTSGLGLASPQILEFRNLKGLTPTPQTLQINLGNDVYLEDLALTPKGLTCTGGLTIYP